ncbi:DUF6933 domain-containing protein [Enterococcus sp. DIV0170]|uniref:DUF6933 domain-containing protein n=1 Tax=Enterococcus sp. DIV0170 TaxID=2774642 RepID=UPI003F282944
MIINPTKKALPLFNKIPSVADKQLARRFSEFNPLFSWHANYFNVNRKKILLVVNDLTYFPLIFVGIDAKNKGQLSETFQQAIMEVFQAAGIPKKQIEKYLDLAGEVEVNGGYNRVVTGIMKNMIFSLEYHERYDFNTLVDVENSLDLAEDIFKEQYPIDKLREAFKEPLLIHELSQEVTEESYVVKKDWESLTDYKVDGFSGKEVEKALANNRLILNAFKEYLEKSEKLTKKTVNHHLANVEDYLSNYLIFYGFDSAVTTFDVISDFFGWGASKNVWISENAVKKAGTAIKKFYQFLIAAGEVKESAMPEIRDQIELGVETGKMTLMMSDSWY